MTPTKEQEKSPKDQNEAETGNETEISQSTQQRAQGNDHKDVQRTQEKIGWTEQEVGSFLRVKSIKKNQKEMKNTITVVQKH